MRSGALRGDLGLLRQGLELGWRFGLGSLEELARAAWELEHGVYRAGTMRRTPGGAAIPLLNPPLRIGAFDGVALRWDGTPVDPARATVATLRHPVPRPVASVTRDAPLELDVGEGSRYEIALDADPGSGRHAVRIAWHSVAIPPTIWIEFSDVVRSDDAPP